MTDPMTQAERVRRRLVAAEQVVPGDIRVNGSLLLTSPNGTQYVVAVDDNGTLSTVLDDTLYRGPVSPVRPAIASLSATTGITVTDPGRDFTAADRVNVNDQAAGIKLVATITGHPDSHTVTATMPAGSTAPGGVNVGQLYDIQIANGGTVLVTYAGVFTFAP